MFNKIQDGNNVLNDTYVCLSTDAKQTEGIANGDKLIEMDTSKKYNFSADGGEWLAEKSSGGGGGDGVQWGVVEEVFNSGCYIDQYDTSGDGTAFIHPSMFELFNVFEESAYAVSPATEIEIYDRNGNNEGMGFGAVLFSLMKYIGTVNFYNSSTDSYTLSYGSVDLSTGEISEIAFVYEEPAGFDPADYRVRIKTSKAILPLVDFEGWDEFDPDSGNTPMT